MACSLDDGKGIIDEQLANIGCLRDDEWKIKRAWNYLLKYTDQVEMSLTQITSLICIQVINHDCNDIYVPIECGQKFSLTFYSTLANNLRANGAKRVFIALLTKSSECMVYQIANGLSGAPSLNNTKQNT